MLSVIFMVPQRWRLDTARSGVVYADWFGFNHRLASILSIKVIAQ